MAETQKNGPTTEVKGTELVAVHVNAFDEKSAKDFLESFRKAQNNDQDIVPIFIDSYGGACDSLLVMVDVIMSFPGKVITIAVGKAMSCGSVLLACGSSGMRYAAPNSRIMVHHVGSGVWDKLPEMENRVGESKRLQDQIFKIMAKRSGQPADYFLKLLKTHGNLDLFMTPEQALSHKIVDHVKFPVIKSQTFTRFFVK